MENKLKKIEIYNLKKVSKYKLSSYFIVFLLLYLTSSYYVIATDKIQGIISIPVLFCVTLINAFINKKEVMRNYNILSTILLVFLIIVAAIVCIIKLDEIYHYLILFFSLINGYLIYISYSFKRFTNVFIKVMYFLAIFSLLIYLVSIVYPSIFRNMPMIAQRYGVNVHNAFFAITLPDAQFKRNYGMFWEPGAFQIYLNLALIFELFVSKEVNFKRVLIFVFTLGTTFSTTGYFALVIILIAYFINKKRYLVEYKNTFKYLIIFALIIFLALEFIPSEYIDLLFGKLKSLFSETEKSHITTTVRMDAVFYTFEEFIRHPFIGDGFKSFLAVSEEKMHSMPTCTPLSWFALFGVAWGVPCNYFYLKNVVYLKCRTLSKLLIAIVLIMIISTESFLRISIIYVLIFYGVGKCSNSSYGSLLKKSSYYDNIKKTT